MPSMCTRTSFNRQQSHRFQDFGAANKASYHNYVAIAAAMKPATPATAETDHVKGDRPMAPPVESVACDSISESTGAGEGRYVEQRSRTIGKEEATAR